MPYRSDEGPTHGRPHPKTTVPAQKTAGEHSHQGLTGDAIRRIRDGLYMLDEPLIFEPEDRGADFHAAVYAVWPDEVSTVSGANNIIAFVQKGGDEWTAQPVDVKSD